MLELAYVERTTNAACTSTTEGAADTILTLPAVVLDGVTTIALEFFCPYWSQSTSTEVSFLPIFDDLNGGGAASVGRPWDSRAWVTSAFIMGFTTTWIYTPAAGSHVYSARGYVSAASTFTIQAGAGGSGAAVPAFLRALKVETA